jgi:exonuclease SbcC
MIKSISAINFQSWKSLSFEFESGVTLIDGFNYDDETSEGSGKSAILNAMCWGLYGKLPKDAKIDEVIKEGEKSCQVIVVLEDVSIYRSRKPNELKIVRHENNEVIKGKDAKETQNMIEKLIGLSFDTFCQTIYFAQNYPKRFVTSTQEERGKILSEIQDLNVFDKARKEVMNLIKLEESNLKDIRHKLEIQSIHYTNKSRDIESIVQQHNNAIDRKNQQIQMVESKIQQKQVNIDEAKKELVVLQENIKSNNISNLEQDKEELVKLANINRLNIAKLESALENVSDTKRANNNLKSEVVDYDRRIAKIVEQIHKLQDFIKDPSEECPTCGTALGDADTSHAEHELTTCFANLEKLDKEKEEIAARIKDDSQIDAPGIVAELTKQQEKLNKINETLSEIDLRKTKYNNNVNALNYKNNLIETFTYDITQLQQDLELIKNQPLGDLQDKIQILKDECEHILKEMGSINKLVKEKETRIIRLGHLKSGFKEVKSYTFNSVLNELTVKTNQYLTELFDMPLKLQFTNDNMKIQLDIKTGQISRGFGMFSGGQQRRIGLAIDLALSDIVTSRTGTKVDLLILDEPFQNLSESSMVKCINLLTKISKKLVIIEHNTIAKSIVNNTFTVELKDGTSYAA